MAGLQPQPIEMCPLTVTGLCKEGSMADVIKGLACQREGEPGRNVRLGTEIKITRAPRRCNSSVKAAARVPFLRL